MSAAHQHRTLLRELGISRGCADSLEHYLDLVAFWNQRINLTGARTPEERVRRLVEFVIPARDLLETGRLIDVGAGNGSPGVVLALMRPEIKVTLLEPRQRRWAFLREVTRQVARPDIQVLRQRHDAFQGPKAPNVTLRALVLPLRELAALVEPGGQVLVFGGAMAAEPPFSDEPEVAGIKRFRRAT